jgi:hypothetical protein
MNKISLKLVIEVSNAIVYICIYQHIGGPDVIWYFDPGFNFPYGILTPVVQWVRYLDYLTTHSSLSPIWHGFTPGFVNYKKGCTWLAAASDKVYQLLSHGRWFSPGTPASSTTKAGHCDIAEILLKVALNTINQIKSKCWIWLIQYGCSFY